MCFRINPKVTSRKARFAYKILCQSRASKILFSPYRTSVSWNLGQERRISNAAKTSQGGVSGPTARAGLYVYTTLAAALRVLRHCWTSSQEWEYVIVRVTVKPEDFLFSSLADPSDYSVKHRAATYREVKPTKIVARQRNNCGNIRVYHE